MREAWYALAILVAVTVLGIASMAFTPWAMLVPGVFVVGYVASVWRQVSALPTDELAGIAKLRSPNVGTWITVVMARVLFAQQRNRRRSGFHADCEFCESMDRSPAPLQKSWWRRMFA